MNRPLVNSETRAAVHNAVAALVNPWGLPDALTAALVPLGREMDIAPQATIEVLRELVDGKKPRDRIVAAVFILRIENWNRRLVEPGLASAAEARIAESLSSSDEADRLFVCATLTSGVVPRGCVALLGEIMRRSEDLCRYSAAAALSAVGHDLLDQAGGVRDRRGLSERRIQLSLPEIAATLEDGFAVRGKNAQQANRIARMNAGERQALQVQSISGLIRLTQGAERHVIRALALWNVISSSLQYSLTTTLIRAAVGSQQVMHTLETTATNTHIQPAMRGCAVYLVCACAAEAERSLPIVVAALESDEPPVVRGALRAIQAKSIANDEVTNQFARLVRSKRSELRAIGLEGLQDVGAFTPAALAALLDRLGHEAGDEEMGELVRALAKSGPIGAEKLVQIVRGDQVNKRSHAALVLSVMGLVGADALFKDYRQRPDIRVAKALREAVANSGTRAEPLVPAFVELLKGSDNGEVSAACIEFIYWSQTRNPVAIDSLIDAIVNAHPDIAGLAAQALHRIGSAAVAHLKAAEAEAHDDLGRERVQTLIAQLSFGPASTGATTAASKLVTEGAGRYTKHIEAYRRDNYLITFVHAADAWSDGPKSIRNITTKIAEMHGQVLDHRRPVRFRTLSDHLTQIEAWVSTWSREPAMNKAPGVVSGLTPFGVRLAEDIKAYLKAKHGHVPPIAIRFD